MDEVGALVDLHMPVGRDSQAELFQGVGTLGMGIVLVHQGDGAIEQRRVFLHQADDSGVQQRHVLVCQVALLEHGCQGLEQRAVRIIAVGAADGVAQQGAWLDPAKQLDGRLMEKGVGIDQYGHGRAGQHLAQHHVLAAKVIPIGLVPGFTGCLVQ
ncbi:hypothetical protein D9M71_473970 [compost metagenome]